MDYRKAHDAIIARALSRNSVDGYTEKHHIIPRSMGGSNNKSNLVILTAKEHYIVHWLLFKIHKNKEMAFAWNRMTHGKSSVKRYISHTFTHARKTHAEYVSAFLKGKKLTEQHRAALSAAKSGKTYAEIGRLNSPLKGRKVPEAQKIKSSIAAKERNYRHTDEAKEKMRISKIGEKNPNFGKKTPESVSVKISAALKGRNMPYTRERTKRNKSGVVGVSYSEGRGKWCSSIRVSGCDVYLGRFDDFNEAVEARRKAEEKYLIRAAA